MSAVCVSLIAPCTWFFQHGYVVIHTVEDTHSSVATRCFSLNVRFVFTVCVGGLSIWLFVWWIGSSWVLMVHVCIVNDWRMNMRSFLLTLYPWRWACRDVVPWPPPIPLRSVCAWDIVRSKHFFRVHEIPKSLQQFWWVLSPISMRLLQVFCRNSSFSAKVSQVFQLFGKWHLFIVYGFIGECRRIYSVFAKMDSVLMAWSLNDCRGWVWCVLCHVVEQWIRISLRWCCPWFCVDLWACGCDEKLIAIHMEWFHPKNSISGRVFFRVRVVIEQVGTTWGRGSIVWCVVVRITCFSRVGGTKSVDFSTVFLGMFLFLLLCLLCVHSWFFISDVCQVHLCGTPRDEDTISPQPIWFRGVKYAFHMRYLSGQWASVVANCTLFWFVVVSVFPNIFVSIRHTWSVSICQSGVSDSGARSAQY